jgi:hypothetical protein
MGICVFVAAALASPKQQVGLMALVQVRVVA